jgi:hypothetical protein
LSSIDAESCVRFASYTSTIKVYLLSYVTSWLGTCGLFSGGIANHIPWALITLSCFNDYVVGWALGSNTLSSISCRLLMVWTFLPASILQPVIVWLLGILHTFFISLFKQIFQILYFSEIILVFLKNRIILLGSLAQVNVFSQAVQLLGVFLISHLVKLILQVLLILCSIFFAFVNGLLFQPFLVNVILSKLVSFNLELG